MRRKLGAILFLSLFALPAHAYIDPGIVSLVMQWVYIAAGSLFVFLFVNPMNYIKAFFGKKNPTTDAKMDNINKKLDSSLDNKEKAVDSAQ